MTETIKPEKRALFVSLRTQLIVVLSLLFLITFSAIYVWLDRFVTDLAMSNLQTSLIATAKAAAAGVDGDVHTRLSQTGKIDDPDYTRIADFLREVKKTNPQASGVYTYLQLPDKPDQVQLVVSAALPPGSPQQVTTSQAGAGGCLVPSSERPSLNEDYTDISPTMVKGLQQAGAETTLWTDQWGTWLSGYAPIYDAKNQPVGAVGVDMCAKNVIDLQQNIRRNTLIALGVALLILIVVVGLVSNGFTRPVLALTRLADRIGGGDYDLDFASLASPRIQDEVDKLATVFELMVNKVYTREQTLRARVAQLEILIDKSKLETEVQEIVDSDFFQDLKTKVNDMRSRFKEPPSTPKGSE